MNEALERRVRERAKNRYEYCKIPASISEFTFPIDHIIAQQHHGKTTYDREAPLGRFRDSVADRVQSDVPGIPRRQWPGEPDASG
jgi:hypothetical protein